ncbi:MAG TPA: 2-oxo acid dehydrogenase subunit E2 [Candidatus Melainabacteria bacterium]|nr:2-oxo acid dehydrogenase subunit E2 [Candidatus Melainabacteria bacterium]
MSKNISFSWLARCRWNVLDMINVIGRGSVPTYMFYEIDMTWAEQLRLQLKEKGVKVTATAILLKAIGIAQRLHPASRTAILPWGRTVTFNDIVAGFTVERYIGQQPAVFFGAIESPDSKPLVQVAEELRAYGEDDISSVPQLDIEDRFNNMPWLFRRFILWLGMRFPKVRLRYMGATFGLSSLGKFGCRGLIPPCVSTSTFGVGTIEPRAVVREGAIVVRPMMTLILNFDHRLIDGAPAARFMQDVQKLLEGELQQHIEEELRLLDSPSKSMVTSPA